MSRRRRTLSAIETLYEEYGAPVVKEVMQALGLQTDDEVVKKAVKRKAAAKPASKPRAVARPDSKFRGEGTPRLTVQKTNKPFIVRATGQSQIDDMIASGLVRPKEGGYGKQRSSQLYFGESDEALPTGFSAPKPDRFTIVGKSENLVGKDGPISIDELEHVWADVDGVPTDMLPDILRRNQEYQTPTSYTRTEDGPFTRVNREGAPNPKVPQVKEAKNIDEIREILKDPALNFPAKAADDYTQAAFGTRYDVNATPPRTSLEKQSGIARVFQAAAEGDPAYKQKLFEAYGNAMPEVVERAGAQNYDQLTEAAYRKMAEETRAQFDTLPVQTSYHSGVGEYASPSAMLRDMLSEGNLNVFRGGEPHEFLSDVDKTTGLSANEMFRAAHDFYGHGTQGQTFRPGGEEAAYASHAQMMSPLARMALLSETRGQNSLVNYSPINVKQIGEMRDIQRRIDEEKLYLRQRGEKPRPGQFDVENARLRELGSTFEYAPQKAVLLPPEYLAADTTGGVPEYLRDVIKGRAPTGPERAVHLSRTEGLSATDPSFYGTGHRGDDFAMRGKRGSPAQHTSFYLGQEGTVVPERVVENISPYAYETELSGLYDLGTDPEGLVALARAYRPPMQSAVPDLTRMVREYGYGGYKDQFGPQEAANVFDITELQRRIQKGPRGYVEGGLVEV